MHSLLFLVRLPAELIHPLDFGLGTFDLGGLLLVVVGLHGKVSL